MGLPDPSRAALRCATIAHRGGRSVEPSHTVFRTCPLCEATCGLSLTVRGQRVETVRGDPDDVFSRGYLCPKGAALGELHHDADRLRRPRVQNGSGWREVDWEVAFQRVEEGLRPYLVDGPRDAVGVYLGNPNTHNLANLLFVRPVLKALGSRNLFSASTVDQMPREVACGWLYGSPTAIPVPDVDRSSYLLLLGANPLESNGSLWTAPDLPGRLRALRRRGGRLVVVDPIRTRTAALADEHLPIRPGTDAAWLLALAHTLLRDALAVPGRLAAHASGLDTLREWVDPFSPERVADPCGVDAETTVRIARELAAADGAAVYGRMGAHAAAFGTVAAWATDVVNFLTGNLDRAGGVMFPRAVHERVRAEAENAAGGRGFRVGRWHSRVRGEPERRSEFPAAILAEEIEEPGAGQIRALITIAGNPVLSTPNGRRLDAALGTLEFMVSVDPYLNETTRHADVILPPPSPLERSHYDLTYNRAAVRTVAKLSPAVFQPDGPSEAEILARLAAAIGGGGAERVLADALRERIEREVARDASPIAGRDPEEITSQIEGEDPCERIVDFLVRTGPYGDAFGVDPEGLSLARLREAPHGLDFGPMRPALPDTLETPDGKIHLAPDPIAPELERLDAALAAPRAADLLLVGRRHLRSNNSWLHNLPSLARGRDRCTLWMHPDDVRKRELRDREPVEVVSEVGRVVVALEANDAVAAGVVSLPHGYGHKVPGVKLGVAGTRPGVSANDLTEGEMDVASGNAVLNGVPVRVRALP